MNEDELIAQNVATMRAKGATDDQVRHYLTLEGRTPVNPPAPTGNIDLRKGAPAPPAPDQEPMWARINDTMISGFPGAQRAVAGYRGLADLAFGSHTLQGAANEIESTMERGKKNAASLPGAARVPLQVLGGIPAAVALAPLGALAGGAAFGAAQGADRPASSIDERTMNTVMGGGLGAIVGKGSELAGQGIKNLADRSGASDWIASQLQKVAPNAAEVLGTRGQVNTALGKRQSLLETVGAPEGTSAQQQIDREAAFRPQANALYDAARADTRPLQNPELQQILADPKMQQGLAHVSATRASAGRPLPREAAPPAIPAGVTPENWARLTTPEMLASRHIGNTGADILPPELLAGQGNGAELPDPEALHSLIRQLGAVGTAAQKSPSPFSQEEAAGLLPVVRRMRDILHSESPAWAEANKFYANGKGEEEAFAAGVDAYKNAANQSGQTLMTNSPEAMLQEISQPRYPGEPVEAMQARAVAFRNGMKSATSGIIKGEPLTRNLSGILNRPELALTEPGLQQRSLMFDQPEQAKPMESLLAQLRDQGKQASKYAGEAGQIPTTQYSMLRKLARLTTQSPDLVDGPQGASTILERLQNPDLMQQGIGATRATYQPVGWDVPGLGRLGNPLGKPTYKFTDLLANLAKSSAAGQATR